MMSNQQPATSRVDRLIRHIVLAGLLVTTIAVASPAFAFAQGNMKTTTLANTGQGYGSWAYDTSNGSRLRIVGITRDFKPGGNSVYFSAMYQTSSGTCYAASGQYVSGSCSQDFYDYTRVRGTDFNSGEWRTATKYTPVSTTSKGHRANLQVCENVKARPDPCSTWSISDRTYWMG